MTDRHSGHNTHKGQGRSEVHSRHVAMFRRRFCIPALFDPGPAL